MYLRVKEGKIVVTAPFWASDKQINGFIDKHAEWIQKKLLDKNIFLKDGDTITILGNPFQISFTENLIDIEDHQIWIPNDQKIFQAFLIERTKKYLYSRFQELSSQMQISGIKLKFGFYKTKWGSYHPKTNCIRLNMNLIFTDKECIDAILIHELCHVRFQNHQKEFYQEVEKWMPSYRKAVRRLRTYSIPKIK
ncbi:hypothetical protein HNQ43_001387 [Faecalicoccus acidiformans]|uniref:YgjP-like metallopeptidase domain-containing protein n=1 Tax=Faecalicoccus acidiformans TaxID=915173 RepID=A0A7W8FXH8_9FIRM|nr:SprT-like domain-containing protein [Faecalicoccus acidiformans]MBB5185333.1 hypothetical protein [Faecalicoccus acidiformans]